MVKIYFLVALLFVAVAATVAVPVVLATFELMITRLWTFKYLLDNLEEYEPFELHGVEERADRQRRVTCDLLSGFVEHSACAANCLSMGKAGGRCENGICICRKTTFKELWDKRFG
ncbi:Defensin-1 [Melipona quadrifasciata]|uniref:Defensin-1 n=1 Tax=Melipona quadrifasciata TaxID=166423 RepID=A0A0N0U626_9HYME|nr:Defensin-1 [Melipona quadrifasciata]